MKIFTTTVCFYYVLMYLVLIEIRHAHLNPSLEEIDFVEGAFSLGQQSTLSENIFIRTRLNILKI